MMTFCSSIKPDIRQHFDLCAPGLDEGLANSYWPENLGILSLTSYQVRHMKVAGSIWVRHMSTIQGAWPLNNGNVNVGSWLMMFPHKPMDPMDPALVDIVG